jgi:hypothetical protein
MLTIPGHKGNENNNHIKNPRHSIRMATIKNTNNKHLQKYGGRGTLIHCWWDYILLQPLWKIVWILLKKLKVDLPYDSGRPLLGIYPMVCESIYNKGAYTPMFITALFTRTKLWKQQRCLLLMNGLRKCGIYIQWNFTQPQRRMKFCHLQVNGWNWRTSP